MGPTKMRLCDIGLRAPSVNQPLMELMDVVLRKVKGVLILDVQHAGCM